jgi:hypothetical protein
MAFIFGALPEIEKRINGKLPGEIDAGEPFL